MTRIFYLILVRFGDPLPLIKDMKSSFDLRLRMVQYALKHSKSETSRVFGTTGDTVRKWVERYLKDGPEGLIGRHRSHIHSTHRIPDGLEKRILSFREDFSPNGLRADFLYPVPVVPYTGF